MAWHSVMLAARSAPFLVLLSTLAFGQDPKPDTTRRPVTLPTIQTTAPRDERVVFEQKPNVGTITITGRELTSAPRFFGEADVLRAVRLLPGVTAAVAVSSYMGTSGRQCTSGGRQKL